MGKGKGEDVSLRCERKQFRERGLKIGETDELVIFVISVMVVSLMKYIIILQ